MSEIPGMVAKHAIITDECRAGRGEAGAIDEALARLKAEYEVLLPAWTDHPGTHFHLVLTVEPSRGER